VEKIPDSFPYPFIAYGDIAFLDIARLKGCLDYLKEPWNLDELLFRIERASRLIREGAMGITLNGSFLEFSGNHVHLTEGERRVMKLLISNSCANISRETLFYALWGDLPERKTRIVDVYVSSLRKKLKSLTGIEGNRFIFAVRNSGYRFEPLYSGISSQTTAVP